MYGRYNGGICILVAVIGYGSIGHRHADNIRNLGHTVIVYDVSEQALQKARENGYTTCSTINEVLKYNIDFAVIATPTDMHIQNAMSFAVEGIHVFVEKPLSYNMDGIQTLLNICSEQNIKLMCACNLRFLNGINLIKTLLSNNTIGKVYTSQYFYGWDLRKWHLNSDYTKSYSAGIFGGIALDDIHAADLMLYLFNKITDIKGFLTHTKTLKIAKEEIADYTLLCEDVVCHIHSDYLSPEYTRSLEIYGTEGIIQYDIVNGQVNLKTQKIDEWRTFSVAESINMMYLHEMEYYISCISDNVTPVSNGVESLKWILELKKYSL